MEKGKERVVRITKMCKREKGGEKRTKIKKGKKGKNNYKREFF